MRPRYVVINEIDRNEFEKKWEIPFGYGECDIHITFEDAIDELEAYYGSSEWIVEKISENGRETIYRGGVLNA